jgi:hypothetical protein
MSSNVLRPPVSAAVAAIAIWLAMTMSASISALAQTGECALIADDRNPAEHVMRCGDDLVIRRAPGARYHPLDQQGKQPPKALELDAGAVMIEFHPSAARKNFQILTPHAIAAVRGTKWIVDVDRARTSTLVLSGAVAVARRHADQTVVLRPGQGVDVSAGTSVLAAKRWPAKRVKALLARFGE